MSSSYSRIIAIDPGPKRSAVILIRPDRHVVSFNMMATSEVLEWLKFDNTNSVALVIEKMQAMGMAVGAEVFDTCYNIGRYIERFAGDVYLIRRTDVKMNCCGTPRAKDKNIRQAMIDRYGGDSVAVGRKKTPGPLYGISGDLWSALAIGNTFIDLMAYNQITGMRVKEVIAC